MPKTLFRLLLIPGILGFLPARSAGPSPPDIPSCLAQAPEARATCLQSASLPSPVDRRALDALRQLIDTNAADVERLAGAGSSGAAQAELLELEGLALARLGRAPEAAAAMRAAIAIDDGMSRLTWRSAERSLWSTTLDPGNGRLVRAAQVLIDAGDVAGARPWLEQALAAGAGGAAKELWDRTGGGAVAGLGEAALPLRAPDWFPPLPAVKIRRLNDEEAFDPESVRGKVLLLDFWASWCAPCLRELPELSALQERHREKGLVVFTVNARETRTAAESTFRSLGLKLPIGVYDDALERAFNVRMLPTLILVDREGRIRARWDSRVPDIEKDVEAKLRLVLSGDTAESTRPVAEILTAGESLTPRWTREVPSVVDATAIVGRAADAIVVAAGDQWFLVDRDGRVTRRSKLPQGSPGVLIPWSIREGQVREFLSLHPGRDEVGRIDASGRAAPGWKSATAILSAAVLAAGSEAPRGIVATAKGFGALGENGSIGPWPGVLADACGLAASSDAGVAAVGRKGQLAWFDSAGRVTASATAPASNSADPCGPLLAKPGSGEIGVTPASVRASAVGHLVTAEAWHAAVATADDQLVIVDLSSGAVHSRARWPGIRTVAAGDIDGDGLDELVVADGRRVTLLAAPPKPARGSGSSKK